MIRTPCRRCMGTDTARECGEGQCYAEECDRQQEEEARNQEQWENDQRAMERHFEEYPHG